MATSRYEMWKILENLYENRSQIKESKISMLIHEYELFEMKSDKSITQMIMRFTNITNDLHALRKTYSNTEMITKVPKILTKAYQKEVIAIQEEKDVTNVPLEELIKFLISREIMMIKNENQDGEEENEMKATYVDTRNNELNKKVQGDNICFMAIEDEVSSLEPKSEIHDDSETSCEFSENDSDCDLSYKNLLSDFNDLHKNYEKLIFKNNALKKKILSLSKMVEEFTKEKEVKLSCSNCDVLSKENTSLNDKIFDLTTIVHKLTNGKKNFDLMLSGQKCVFDKGGIGYKSSIKQKYLKNYFEKASTSDTKHTCTYCNQDGHTSLSCFVKKNAYFGGKLEWVPKNSKTNLQGPKVMWVPKIHI